MRRGWVSAWRASEIILVAAAVLLVAGSAGAVNIHTGFEAAEGYQVVVLEPDPDVATRAKTTLAGRGLYGGEIQVIQSCLAETLLTPYWANLVIVQSLDGFASTERALSMALDALRPHTGRLQLSGPQRHANALDRLLSDRAGYTKQRGPAQLTICRAAAAVSSRESCFSKPLSALPRESEES